MSQETYSSWQPDSSVSVTSRFPYRLFINTVLFSVKPPSCFEHILVCLTCRSQEHPHGLACSATSLCCHPFREPCIWSGLLLAEYILAELGVPSFPSLCWTILICGGSERWVSTSLPVVSFSVLNVCFLDFFSFGLFLCPLRCPQNGFPEEENSLCAKTYLHKNTCLSLATISLLKAVSLPSLSSSGPVSCCFKSGGRNTLRSPLKVPPNLRTFPLNQRASLVQYPQVFIESLYFLNGWSRVRVTSLI